MSIDLMTRVFKSEKLGPTARLIMLSLADNADDEGVCYPSIAKTCSKTGLSERAVRTNIRALEAEGYLSVKVGAGRGGANLYIVIPDPAGNAPGQEMPPGRKRPEMGQEVPPDGAGGAPKPSLPPTEPESWEQSFKQFWRTYPRRRGRDICRQLFRDALHAGEDGQAIVTAAKRYATENATSETRFKLYSDNWLKKRPWRDEDVELDQQGDRREIDWPACLAEKVNAGVYVPEVSFTTSIVHEILRRNLLTSQQLRGIGVYG